MAFKMSKATVKERDDMVFAARAKLDILNGKIAEFNEAVSDAWGAVEEALNDYNGARCPMREISCSG